MSSFVTQHLKTKYRPKKKKNRSIFLKDVPITVTSINARLNETIFCVNMQDFFFFMADVIIRRESKAIGSDSSRTVKIT